MTTTKSNNGPKISTIPGPSRVKATPMFPRLGSVAIREREELHDLPEVQEVSRGLPVAPDEIALPPRFDLAPAPPERKQLERRPNKFTPLVRRKVLAALKMGHVPRTAAGYAGITMKTLLNWWERGQLAGAEGQGVDLELYEFSEECLQARALPKVGLVAILWRHARRDGKVALGLLEKLFPEEYGRQTQHKVSGTVEHEHSEKKTDFSRFSDEELADAERLALKAQRERMKDEAIDAEIVE